MIQASVHSDCDCKLLNFTYFPFSRSHTGLVNALYHRYWSASGMGIRDSIFSHGNSVGLGMDMMQCSLGTEMGNAM